MGDSTKILLVKSQKFRNKFRDPVFFRIMVEYQCFVGGVPIAFSLGLTWGQRAGAWAVGGRKQSRISRIISFYYVIYLMTRD